jgi:enoyl-CoA hydratase
MSIVRRDLREDVALITMDDGKANALSYEMMDAVERALDETGDRPVVLAGRAGKFCAGFDLRQMMAGAEQARALVGRGASFLMRLYLLPQPLVIACGGHALAGGALVVLTGDLRIAARGPFRLGLNEVQIGLPMPILAMELARDRLEPRHLAAATLFATIDDPERALTTGWIDELVEAEALEERAIAEARRLGQLPRAAYARTKAALRERTVAYIRETLETDIARLSPPSAV